MGLSLEPKVNRPNRALFLDRDGIINVNHGYVSRPEDFDLVDGIIDLVKRANDADVKVIVVTNQSGIGRGYYSEDIFTDLTSWMIKLFASFGATIDKVYFCPHHPSSAIGTYLQTCKCRKPSAGMAIAAQQDFNLDLHQSIMVGDKKSDMEFAKNANMASAYWLTNAAVGFEQDGSSATQIKRITSLSQIHI